ncbi:MAG: DegT/DnrJ/EryC1/StrS family aminotransferase, partial [Verrucomicrobia bacterium]|nr:DegT/DnrJ/EryC1/StrS family aminotransferase [Verrucomicrobiota bacterium]
MQVKYLNLKKQFVSYDIRAVVNELVAGCQFVLGPQVERFEKAFAEYCEVPYALGVNSGTDALFLALRVLGIGPQDEVITAPNSFLATAASIANVGAKPVFVDVADDYNINPDLIETAITSKTKAIMPVHLTGNPAVMDKIMAIARKHA